MLSIDRVVKGLWNTLEVLIVGVWWIAIVFALNMNRHLKITTVVLGASCLVDVLGELLLLPQLAEIGLNLYLILAIIWPVWSGIEIIRRKI